MPEVISNTSCLIALDNIGRLELLQEVYGKILVTEQVAAEYGKAIPENFVEVVSVVNEDYVRILALYVDAGEASTIALGLEKVGSLLILDDGKARRLADQLGVTFTGLLGVILKGKKMGLVPAVADVIHELKDAGFRIAASVENEVLQLAGEKDE